MEISWNWLCKLKIWKCLGLFFLQTWDIWEKMGIWFIKFENWKSFDIWKCLEKALTIPVNMIYNLCFRFHQSVSKRKKVKLKRILLTVLRNSLIFFIHISPLWRRLHLKVVSDSVTTLCITDLSQVLNCFDVKLYCYPIHKT